MIIETMRKIIMILGILLLSAPLVSANGDHQSKIEEGKKLVEIGVSCDKLNDEQLEAIGEYLMEQMHPVESHEAMHKMMEMEEGTEYHKQVHVNIARMMYCGEGGMMPMIISMISGNMMNWEYDMMRGMIGNWGYSFGYWNFVNVLYIILLIGLIILVYLWIIKLWKDMKNKGGKKRKSEL